MSIDIDCLYKATDDLYKQIIHTESDLKEEIDKNYHYLDDQIGIVRRSAIRSSDNIRDLTTNLEDVSTSIDDLKKEIKDLKDTVEFIEIFLGEHYAELKKLNSQLLEKDE